MDYGVTAEVTPPEGTSELDALQREGVAALLERFLDRLRGAVGSNDVEIDVLDYWVGAYPEGALVLLVVDAPAIEVAEETTEPLWKDQTPRRTIRPTVPRVTRSSEHGLRRVRLRRQVPTRR